MTVYGPTALGSGKCIGSFASQQRSEYAFVREPSARGATAPTPCANTFVALERRGLEARGFFALPFLRAMFVVSDLYKYRICVTSSACSNKEVHAILNSRGSLWTKFYLQPPRSKLFANGQFVVPRLGSGRAARPSPRRSYHSSHSY
jgi:hypothetical protein